MSKKTKSLETERIREAVSAAEDKYFRQNHKIGDITDLTTFGIYLVAEAKKYGGVMVKAGIWRSNYPHILEDTTIKLARKRMEYYRDGLGERDATDS